MHSAFALIVININCCKSARANAGTYIFERHCARSLRFIRSICCKTQKTVVARCCCCARAKSKASRVPGAIAERDTAAAPLQSPLLRARMVCLPWSGARLQCSGTIFQSALYLYTRNYYTRVHQPRGLLRATRASHLRRRNRYN